METYWTCVGMSAFYTPIFVMLFFAWRDLVRTEKRLKQLRRENEYILRRYL